FFFEDVEVLFKSAALGEFHQRHMLSLLSLHAIGVVNLTQSEWNIFFKLEGQHELSFLFAFNRQSEKASGHHFVIGLEDNPRILAGIGLDDLLHDGQLTIKRRKVIMIIQVIPKNDLRHIDVGNPSFVYERGEVLNTIGTYINGQYMHGIILTKAYTLA